MMAILLAMVVIVVVPVAVFVVVRATFWLPGQLPVQVSRDQRFGRLISKPRHDVDALLSKECQRSLADTSRDDKLNPEAVQPPRKRARLVFGGRQRFGMQNGFGVRIHFDDGKFSAAAEVGIETTVFNRNGNFHSFVCFVIFR